MTVTAYEKVQPGKKSYTDVVDKLAATKPDVIYSAVYYPEGGLIAKEMLEARSTRSASPTTPPTTPVSWKRRGRRRPRHVRWSASRRRRTSPAPAPT